MSFEESVSNSKMEFLDEYESRPRFLFQSKQQSPLPSSSDSDIPSLFSPFSSLHKPTLFLSLSLSIIFFLVAFLSFTNSEPLKSILLWLASSLLLGPFAPLSLTAGDIRVGLGPPLPDPQPLQTNNEKPPRKTKKPFQDSVKPEQSATTTNGSKGGDSEGIPRKRRDEYVSEEIRFEEEEREWSEADEEMLKKLMGKHPVGKPGRWEAIAEGLKGKHKVESVILKAKEMGERRAGDEDAFKKFLKDRKPVDRRVVNENGDDGGRKESGWTAGDDLALLNALKAFPKDVAMRWEKIAAAVPGKTKAVCVKRVAELKKDFRSNKAASGQA